MKSLLSSGIEIIIIQPKIQTVFKLGSEAESIEADNIGTQQRLRNFHFQQSTFEVDEDRLGFRYTQTSICLFVYT